MNRATWTYTAGTVGLLVGFFLTFIGIEELRLSLQSGRRPQELPLDQLARTGPAGNAHVALTRFSYRREGCLATGPGVNGPLQQVWVPLAPESAGPPSGRDVCVVVMLNRAHTWDEVDRLLDRGRLTGIIKSRGGFDHAADLESRNPGLRASQCWEVWEGHAPWALSTLGAMLAGGVLLFALGLFLVDLARRLSATSVQPLVPVVAFMSPLVFVMDGLTQLFRMLRLSRRWNLVLLGGAGLALLATGGRLLAADGLFSLEGLTGWLVVGMLCVNLGVGLLALAAATALRDDAGPSADEPSSPPIRFEPRKVGGFLLAVAAGLLLAGFRWVREVHPMPAFVPVMIGIAVTLAVLGLYLLIGRPGERIEEVGRVPSDP